MGDYSNFVFRQKLVGENGSVRRGLCHGETARFVLAKVGGDVFARFDAVAANLRGKTRNSPFSLL